MRAVLLAAALLIASPAFALDQTKDNCTTCSGTNWTSPTNVRTEDSSYATYSDNQDILTLRDYSFAISSSSVDGVEVIVNGHGVDAAQTGRREIEVTLTKDGSAQCSGASWVSIVLARTTPDNTTTVGGAADIWCTSLSEAEVENANFGILLRDINAGTHQLDVDHVQLKVTYSPATTTTTSSTTSTTTGGGRRVFIF